MRNAFAKSFTQTIAQAVTKTIAVACCAALCLAFAGCGNNQNADGKIELQVFAANSMEKALPEVQALFTEKNPNVVFADTQFKGSGDLVAQLEGGASADILITASESFMDRSVDNGLIYENTYYEMFMNDMVVITKSGSKLSISDIKDLATNDQITSIAIGDPNAVPAGKYALNTFVAAGLATPDIAEDGTIKSIQWNPSIAEKINAGADKVGTVASYVSEGQCDVGLVYSSDLYRYDGIQSIFTVPASMHKTIMYPGAVLDQSAHHIEARQFLKFCTEDPEALQIWQKYGFELFG